MPKITEIRIPKTRRKKVWEDGVMVEKVLNGYGNRPLTTTKPGIRFLHYLIDLVITFFAFVTLGVVLILAGIMDEYDLDNYSTWLFYGVWLSYYISFEFLFQRTLGKMITGSWVIDEEGQRPPFLRILGRSLARMIPFEALSCFGTRGWHDTLSKTYVVPKKEYKELQRLLSEEGQGGMMEQGEDGFQEDFF